MQTFVGGGLGAKLCMTRVTPRTVARQAPLSMGFSRQGYWSGLPFPSPGDLPYPGIEPRSALQADSLATELQGKPDTNIYLVFIVVHRIGASSLAQLVKNPPTSSGDTGDTGLIPGLGRSPGGGNATHSSILAWEIPRTEEPGGLQSMRLQRVGHD